jgi:translation initiation factor 5A
VSLLTESGDMKDDLDLPKESGGAEDDITKQLKQLFADGKSVLVAVLSACGQEKIVAVKEISG